MLTTMPHRAFNAEAPRALKRLLDPLTLLLGVPTAVQTSLDAPAWPDPGREAHIVLHREFAEHGPCPLLHEEAALPMDGSAPTVLCPLGLTVRRFALPLGQGRTGLLTIGPYFKTPQERQALAQRSMAADAALAVLPCVPADRHGLLKNFYREFAAFAGTAAAAGAVKETFLANMSHELRTPLNGIMGMLSLLLQGELPDRQRQFLELAMDASNQLLGVVNDLLEMNNIATGRLELADEPFFLRRGLAPLFSACAEDAARRGLTFSATVDDDVPDALSGDLARLRQVLLNLIGNAVKFTQEGSVRVHIARDASPKGQEDVALRCRVRDTGVGIPAEKQQLIFERFAIGENFLNKRHAATGLGLSISKEIVEKMGGRLSLASAPGEGSEFTFTAQLRLSEPVRPTFFACQGAVIACAEDEPVSQLLMRSILEDQGYVALVADSALKLLDVLAGSRVDMVLMDMQLPEGGGLELAGRIRAGAGAATPADVPILGLSTATSAEEHEKWRAAGISGHILKPVTRQRLLDAVSQALARSRSTSNLKSEQA
ncbi:ATP-binding protein [Solidesulfovibrio alcoholivorans]|uniref:ATP-binding protein n=1 Tax=Solidesulfovibrio alcoholivorans TaxID=81406 RepID=UPI000A90CD12|nr:ATP-binding protein [Solidesulfovibrio alcoholivorans]